MTAKALVAAFALVSIPALAQSSTQEAAAKAGAAAPSPDENERIRREVDARVEEAKKELREEMKAELASQTAAQSWQEEWSEEKRKLEVFVPNGYFRIRPDLFNKFDLSRPADPAGYTLFPRTNGTERTITGVNMRFRFEPTLNVSEEVRIKSQVDLLNNVLWGSTPDYAYSRADRTGIGLLTEGQVPPQAGLNAPWSSVMVRRVWAEVSTPVGILRFGRMGSQWGLGMLHNDGNCLDCDFGETVDRVQFVVEPLSGYFIIPMVDINAVGRYAGQYGQLGQPYDLSSSDDTYSLVLVLARRDTETQARARLDNDLAVFNYGLHFTYRQESYESACNGAGTANGSTSNNSTGAQNCYTYQDVNPYDPTDVVGPRVSRNGTLYVPDFWLKYERKKYKLELEAAAMVGNVNIINPLNSAQTLPLTITEWAATEQSEYRFLDGALRVGLDMGVASGDKRPGIGDHPGRVPLPGSIQSSYSGVGAVPGDIDGPKFCIPGVGGGCGSEDLVLRNFLFNRDYRVDLILWREILGGVTSAFYVRPTASYTVTQGFSFDLAGIYSQALYPQSTPSYTDPKLGVELDVGAKYVTEDGFFTQLQYGILFPLGGLKSYSGFDPNAANESLDIAQAVRANIGIKF